MTHLKNVTTHESKKEISAPSKFDQKSLITMGSGGGGPVVSMLAFYFDDPSSNDAETYIVL